MAESLPPDALPRTFEPLFQATHSLIWVWLLLAVLLVGLALWRTPARLGAWPMAALVAGSFLLRVLLGTPGPGNPDILFEQYGQAPLALLSLWALVGGPTPDTLILTARVLGALAPALLALAAFELKPDRRLAFAAGVLVAIQPLLIRFSSDCERQSYVLFLGAAALWGLARHLRTRSLVAFLVYVLAAFLCIQSRPEAFALIPISAALVWPGHRWRRDMLPVAVSLAGLIVWAVLQFPPGAGRIEFARERHLDGVFFDGAFTSFVIQWLVFGGILVGLWRRDRAVIWAAFALLVVQLVSRDRPVDNVDLFAARFRTLGYLPFAFLGGYALTELADRLRGFRFRAVLLGAIWVAIGLSSIPPARTVLTPRTMDLEYQFLVRAVPDLPADAQVFFPASGRDLEFRAYRLVSRLVGRADVIWREWSPAGHDPRRPSFFYLHSLCNANPDVPRDGPWDSVYSDDPAFLPPHLRLVEQCADALRHQSGPPRIQETLPARRFSHDRYLGTSMRIGFVPLRLASDGNDVGSPR